ncbi:MAG: RIP metalloprotease RseP [Thermoanaerobaculaceae bacterium]|nr:RIP metalloprotease RseP [Thermoanaerobaculaceae bacterium]TAM52341.1 MAG: RIP metalloprotease RseP [Acidobacteriota bacterium]
MLVNIVALVIVLGVLVLLHEGGHFALARALAARVSVFSFGFGKRLFGFERGGTDYRVSLIPLGGYVRIHGLGPDESDVVGGAEAAPEPLLARWRRALILVAGPTANIIGAVFFVTVAFVLGVQVPAMQDKPPQVAWVDPGSPAAAAGLKAGDLVLAVDGKPVPTWGDLDLATMGSAGRAIVLRFRRDGRELSATLTPRAVTRDNLGYAGLAPPLPAEVPSVLPGSAAEQAGLRAGDRILAVNGERVRHFFDVMRLVGASPNRELTLEIRRGAETLTVHATPRDVDGQGKLGIPAPYPTELRRLAPPAAFVEAVRENVRMTRETFAVIGRMLSGRTSIKQMSGPIDIARFSGAAARSGTVSFIWLLGMISLQLGIFNLLPIPVLDGGHLAVLAVESALRRDFSDRTKERILNTGFWLVIALMVVVIFNDMAKNFPFLDRLLPGRK